MSASPHGSAPSGGSPRPLRSIPRSRAYWELKAEQMMNRIFHPADPIDLAVEPTPDPQDQSASAAASAGATPFVSAATGRVGSADEAARPAARGQAVAAAPVATGAASATAATAPSTSPLRPHRASSRSVPPRPAATGQGGRQRRPDERLLLVGTLCGVCLASVVGSLLYFGHWTRLQQAISQERNLLLLERLRSLGPATPTPVSAPQPAPPSLPAPATQSASDAEGLPPPPPQEAWIEQLSSLPQAAPTPARVLTVPVSPRLAAPSARVPAAAPASMSSSAAPPLAPLPQLVGVVAGAGRSPSAIFLVGGNSMSVSSGEPIGATGWRLRSAEGETALIERGSELRQVSIASGNGF